MKITVVFLGPARDMTGVDSTSKNLAEGTTVDNLRQRLAEEYPKLGIALGSIRFAVNETFVADDAILRDGDEVALIPPVSGGSSDATILVDLVTHAIHAEEVRTFVMGDASLGGIATFEGTTRKERDPEHGELVRLDYEAYESMAKQQLERIAADVKARWPVGRVAIMHRTGGVAPGEVSVMIAVACPHRAEAFESCRWLIDTLKKDVPIWKKDVFEDGFVRWIDPNPDGPRP